MDENVLATLTAAKNKPENSTWMDGRSEWLSSTGEILPESVAEFTKQAVLAGIDPNAFLDEWGLVWNSWTCSSP